MLLKASSLGVTRAERTIFKNASIEIDRGEVVGLIGPNGAGKTTLMRALLGLIPCKGHSSLLDYSIKERPKHAAWLPQQREIVWPVDVEMVVTLGRIPHAKSRKSVSAQDREVIEQALSDMNLLHMRTRKAADLSRRFRSRASNCHNEHIQRARSPR